MVNYLRLSIQEKIINIKLHSQKIRVKRRFLNGSVSFEKAVTATGSFDAGGSRKFNDILNHLQSNLHQIQNHFSLQYTLNNELVKKMVVINYIYNFTN